MGGGQNGPGGSAGASAAGAGGATFQGTGGSPGQSDGGGCQAVTSVAERVTTSVQVPVKTQVTTRSPVALYLMQDRSGSMNDSTGIPFLSASKWTVTTNAINSFAVDPKSDGLDVALQFFPISAGQCDGTAYDTPAVPLKRLLDAQQAQAIGSALTANAPGIFGGGGGGTPLEGGLRGAENFCMQFQAQHPDVPDGGPKGEKCVVVLITDGAPNGCAQDSPTLVGIAADAWTRANVMTFTLGMTGADFTLLNGIAAAGHSDCTPGTPGNEACDVTSSSTGFSDALNLIRDTVTTTTVTYETHYETHTTALQCEYQLPPPPDGQTFDRDKVNVKFSHDGAVDTILRVSSPADCANFQNRGWYYDDPVNPTEIKVCPSTCDGIKASTGDGGTITSDSGTGPSSASAPRVDIVLGCATQVAVPS